MLGYLNFATGKPDVRFPKQLNEALAFLSRQSVPQPWKLLPEMLRTRLKALQAGGSTAFQDASQAEAVLEIGLVQLPAAYRRHHEDLLSHLHDDDLFQPFFLARCCESVLAQGGPWNEQARILSGSLRQLNDFVGYRPVAILETRPRGEPYEQERVRPIPLCIRGAGVVFGRY